MRASMIAITYPYFGLLREFPQFALARYPLAPFFLRLENGKTDVQRCAQDSFVMAATAKGEP